MSSVSLFQDNASYSTDCSSSSFPGYTKAPLPTAGRHKKGNRRCGGDGNLVSGYRSINHPTEDKQDNNISSGREKKDEDMESRMSMGINDEDFHPTQRKKKVLHPRGQRSKMYKRLERPRNYPVDKLHTCNTSDSSEFESHWQHDKNHKNRKNLKAHNIPGKPQQQVRKTYSKPFPRTAPRWCSADSGCHDAGYGDPCCATCDPDQDCAARDVSFLRMMKARMVKLEDTLDLMYKKFKLHEDNIDEMQERLYVYEFGTPGSIGATVKFYIAIFTCTIFPIIVVELLYTCVYPA